MTWERQTQTRLRQYYDMVATEYDCKYKNGQLIYMRRVERELLEQHICIGQVLDVGCGTGNQVIWLAKHGIDVIGLDFSPHTVKIARNRIQKENLGRKVSFIIGDAGYLPFRPAVFDSLVSILGAYNHVSNVEEGFSEMYRVLKQKETVITTLINKWGGIQFLSACKIDKPGLHRF